MSIQADSLRQARKVTYAGYSDGRIHLKDRLYVPEHMVTQFHIDSFTYKLKTEIELADGSTESVWESVELWEQIGNYFAFHRGDLMKLVNLWPQMAEAEYFVDERCVNPLPFKLELKPGFEYRHYATGDQHSALAQFLNPNVGGIFKAFPSFGKTAIMTLNTVAQQMTTLVIAHKTDLLGQFMNTVRGITNIDDFMEDGICYNMYELSTKWDLPPIGVCTFQFLLANPEFAEIVLSSYAIIAIDECHHVGADGFTAITSTSSPYIRCGYTATPYRMDGWDIIFDDVLGPLRVEIDRPPSSITGHVFDTGVQVPPKYEYSQYPMNMAYNFLGKHEERNRLIAEKALIDVMAGHCVLILVYRVSQIDNIWAELETLLNHPQYYNIMHIDQVEWIYREFSFEQKCEVRERLQTGESKIVITTAQLFGEGSDIPIISSCHYTYPQSNDRNLDQILGRIERSDPNKKKPSKMVYYKDTGLQRLFGISRGWVNKLKGFGVTFHDLQGETFNLEKEAKKGKQPEKMKLPLWKTPGT